MMGMGEELFDEDNGDNLGQGHLMVRNCDKISLLPTKNGKSHIVEMSDNSSTNDDDDDGSKIKKTDQAIKRFGRYGNSKIERKKKKKLLKLKRLPNLKRTLPKQKFQL